MEYSFWTFATVAVAFAGPASLQQTTPVNTTTQLMEVDIVFPRNETYRLTEIIPIVLVVQNLPTGKVNNTAMTWGWEIVPYAFGVVPWDYPYDMGTFEVLPNDSPATDPTFLIAVTNVTQWYYNFYYNGYKGKDWGEKNMLSWGVLWNRNYSRYCSAGEQGKREAVMFDVERSDNNEWSARYNYTNGIPAEIPLAPLCPKFDQVAEVILNPTTTRCPLSVPTPAVQGNPCAVTINKVVASSLSSRLASLSSRQYATSTTTAVPTSRSKGGAGAARTLPTALAAAGVLYGLALA